MSNNPTGEVVIQGVTPSILELFFVDSPALRTLANTSLSSLPWPAIQKNSLNLEELDLSNNRFTELLPNQLSLIRNLKRLSLKGNPIGRIQPGALNSLFLDKLHLSGMQQNILIPGVFQVIRLWRFFS